jgi:hypothetical protein
VTSASHEATLRHALARAEARMQDCLAGRPPPFFVQRQLNMSAVAAGDRVRLLRAIFPTVDDPASMEMLALADAGAFTQRDDVACLNRYFYADVGQFLDTSAADARELLDRARNVRVDELVYAASELLGYLLVEKCWWHFISQPLVAIRFDPAVMSEAASQLVPALEEAKGAGTGCAGTGSRPIVRASATWRATRRPLCRSCSIRRSASDSCVSITQSPSIASTLRAATSSCTWSPP